MKERPLFKKRKRKKLPFNQRSDGPLSAPGHRALSLYIILLPMPLFPVQGDVQENNNMHSKTMRLHYFV